MVTKSKSEKREAQNPLILRCHRLMEAFAKSNDERDFFMDRMEGFLIYVDLDKSSDELHALEEELESHPERYCPIPKLTLYETKKIMEGFVNEKVYDIDTKEKLLDIIQSKEARENFLEFIYDHHAELEKWQQYYQERSRIRIIEWLRQNHFHFVFEEDLDLAGSIIEKLKKNLFEKNSGKDVDVARKVLLSKAKTYYSNEALNPRPKRGRPPKQIQKLELEPQMTTDIYLTAPSPVRPFLYIPEISSLFDVTFSSRFESGQEFMASRRPQPSLLSQIPENLNNISQKLAALRQLSSASLNGKKTAQTVSPPPEPVFELKPEDKAIFKKLEGRKNRPPEQTDEEFPSKRKPVAPKTVKKLVLKPSIRQEKKSTPQEAKTKITKSTLSQTTHSKSKSSKEKTPLTPKSAKTPLRKISPKPVAKGKPKAVKSSSTMLRRTESAVIAKPRHMMKLRKKK